MSELFMSAIRFGTPRLGLDVVVGEIPPQADGILERLVVAVAFARDCDPGRGGRSDRREQGEYEGTS
jgi:hypothetical protein